MKYREIILSNIREAIKKKDKAEHPESKKYWENIISELIADLREYETRSQTRAFQWPRRRSLYLDVENIIRRFFEDEF